MVAVVKYANWFEDMEFTDTKRYPGSGYGGVTVSSDKSSIAYYSHVILSKSKSIANYRNC